MRIGLVVVALLLGGCGVWSSTPGVGDCAELRDYSRSRTELSKVDCSSPAAMYKLVDTVSGRTTTCPSGDYVEETSRRSRKTGNRTKQCFVLNVREGECLRPVDWSYERTACGGTAKRVSKVVNGKADATQCGADDSRVYTRPPSTICITK